MANTGPIPERVLSHLNTLWPVLISAELLKHGIDTFFISPGNRNVPIIAALNAVAGARMKTGFDERAMAYRAIGHAKATGRPGVLICTSGTAAANYYPALIEAFRDEIPMIVWSADRPPELVDSDANQTIRQPGLFGGFVRERLDLPCPSPDFLLRALLARIDYLAGIENGPVHINLPFREPLLAEATPARPPAWLEEAKRLLAFPYPFTGYPATRAVPEDPGKIRKLLADTRRGLLVIGRLGRDEDRKRLRDFAEQLGWPVFCDIASGLKGGLPANLQLALLDHPAALKLIKDYAPDTVLQFGTGLVSKWYYGAVLEGAARRPCLIQISPRTGVRDPGHQVAFRMRVRAQEAIDGLSPLPDSALDRPALEVLKSGFQALEKNLARKTPADKLSLPLVAKCLYDLLPAGEALFAGNSLAIRALDQVLPSSVKEVEIISNRGVSGIEGNIATALGYAEGAGRRVTVLLGDIAFLHDLNSLALLGRAETPVIVMVVNNRGGRIFERLPVARFPEVLTPWTTTPHTWRFQLIAEQFGLPFREVRTPEGLDAAYGDALRGKRPAVIEICLVPEEDNDIFERRRDISKQAED